MRGLLAVGSDGTPHFRLYGSDGKQRLVLMAHDSIVQIAFGDGSAMRASLGYSDSLGEGGIETSLLLLNADMTSRVLLQVKDDGDAEVSLGQQGGVALRVWGDGGDPRLALSSEKRGDICVSASTDHEQDALLLDIDHGSTRTRIRVTLDGDGTPRVDVVRPVDN